MAPNSSSMFNEGPSETKTSSHATSAATSESPLISSPPSSIPSTDARPVPVVSSTSSTTSSTESSKQVAPQMEQAIEEHCSSLSKPTDLSVGMRFARVSPVGLDDVKATIPLRKSCLKRSSSLSLPAVRSVLPYEFDMAQRVPAPVVVEKETKPEAPVVPNGPVQKNRRRCWECKAKVGLTAVTCRCEFTFCNKHRYAEEHNCQFNFKTAGKRKLEEENPRVVPAKFARMS